MRKYLIYIFIALHGFTFSQEPIFNNIGTSNGIPSSETYNVFQDSKGYVWFGTEAGLCKFNGVSITIYDSKKGLAEKACYGICEHPNGKLWFITSKNRVLYYDALTDSLVEALFSKKLKEEIGHMPTSQIYSIQTFDDSTLWINAQWMSVKVNFYTNKIEILSPRDEHFYHFEINKNSIFPVKFAAERYLKNINGVPINLKFSNKKDDYSSIRWNNANPPQWRCLTSKNSNNEYFVVWDNYLLKIYNNHIIETYKAETSIISVYCDKKNNLWIGTAKKGAYCFINSSLHQAPVHILEGLSVSGIMQDQENGIWCSTIEKGLFYSRNIHVISYSKNEGLNKKQELLRAISSNLYCVSSLNSIDLVSEDATQKIYLRGKKENIIRDIEPYKNGFLIIGYDGIAYTDKSFSEIAYYPGEENYKMNAGIDIEITNKGRIFIIQNGALMELVNDKKVVGRIPVLKSGANCLTSEDDLLYLGCKDGLYQVSVLDYKMENLPSVKGSVSAFCKTKTKTIVVVTKDDGIYCKYNGKFENITSNLELNNVRMFDISESQNGNLWIASNIGLIKIENNKSVVYNIYNGLPSNEIYKVECTDNDVYFGTNEGLYKIDQQTDLKNNNPPALYLSKAVVNDQKLDLGKGPFVFDYDKNNVHLEFDVLTYKNYGNVQLVATLKGFADSAISINGNKLDFNNLQPGNYELIVYAQNTDGIKSRRPIVFAFQILTPFWETIWFIIVCILIGLAIISGIIYFFVMRIRRKEEEKTKINKLISEYRLTALQAQMNPHFIFNAINSIQTYILENETQTAYDYLSKFAKLIRMVLNNAKEKSIPIEKELELLKIYVELEQLRFENKFEFELDIETDIDFSDVELPPMLIQPYIENAIWHGLMPLGKSKKGRLKLELSKRKQGILIAVEDNGIGRSRSLEQKSGALHGSMGMELTENRLKTMNALSNNETTHFKVIDLIDIDGKPLGTRIEILISKKAE